MDFHLSKSPVEAEISASRVLIPDTTTLTSNSIATRLVQIFAYYGHTNEQGEHTCGRPRPPPLHPPNNHCPRLERPSPN